MNTNRGQVLNHYKIMEKIRIKTAGKIQLDAWRNDTIQFIVLEDLLKAMKVEYVEDVIDYIKQDMHWYTSIKQLDIPKVGTSEAIPITHALGLIYWLPENLVDFITKHEIYNALALHLEFHLELLKWKYDVIDNYMEKMDIAYEKMQEANDVIVNNQALMIEVLKKNFFAVPEPKKPSEIISFSRGQFDHGTN